MVNIERVFQGLLLAAILFPIAIKYFINVDTTNWPTEVKLVWDAIPVFAGIAVGLGFVKYIRTR